MDHEARLQVVAVGLTEDLTRQLREGSQAQMEIIPHDSLDMEPTASDHIAAVLLHECVGIENAANLIKRFHEERRSLPVVWLQETSESLAPFGTTLPDLAWSGNIDPQGFGERLLQLLRVDAYPKAVSQGLAESAQGRMEDSFKVSVRVTGLYLEGDGEPSEINAFVPFCGPYVSGRISVAGPLSTFGAILQRLAAERFGDPVRQAEDLAGEIANQVLGHFKRILARSNLTFNLGTPVLWLWHPRRSRIRFPATRSRLVVSLVCGFESYPLYIGIAVDRLSAKKMQAAKGHTVGAGDLVFL